MQSPDLNHSVIAFCYEKGYTKWEYLSENQRKEFRLMKHFGKNRFISFFALLLVLTLHSKELPYEAPSRPVPNPRCSKNPANRRLRKGRIQRFRSRIRNKIKNRNRKILHLRKTRPPRKLQKTWAGLRTTMRPAITIRRIILSPE